MNNKQKKALDNASFLRIDELGSNPVNGNFDINHLKEIHRRIFQDAPKYNPFFKVGVFRPELDQDGEWSKIRKLENEEYRTFYSPRSELETQLDKVLRDGIEVLRSVGKNKEKFIEAMAKFYGDIDYLHPFGDGNSRTLREFTRQLALEIGFNLDWGKALNNPRAMEILYIARDKEVTDRFFPFADKEYFRNNGKQLIVQMKAGEWDGDYLTISCITLYGKYADSKPLIDIIRDATTLLEASREKSQKATKRKNRGRGLEL